VTIPTSGAICAPVSAAHSRRRTPARWVLQDGFATGKVPSHRDAGFRTALVYRVVPSKGKVCPIGVGEITLFLSVMTNDEISSPCMISRRNIHSSRYCRQTGVSPSSGTLAEVCRALAEHHCPIKIPGCGARLPFGPGGRMLSVVGTMESSMSKAGLDNRHRNHDGEISHKHGNTLVRTLRRIYGQGFAAGYPETEKLSDVLLQLNETSLSQLRRDHETGHLEHKIANASK
jgi:hypothetical protein